MTIAATNNVIAVGRPCTNITIAIDECTIAIATAKMANIRQSPSTRLRTGIAPDASHQIDNASAPTMGPACIEMKCISVSGTTQPGTNRTTHITMTIKTAGHNRNGPRPRAADTSSPGITSVGSFEDRYAEILWAELLSPVSLASFVLDWSFSRDSIFIPIKPRYTETFASAHSYYQPIVFTSIRLHNRPAKDEKTVDLMALSCVTPKAHSRDFLRTNR